MAFNIYDTQDDYVAGPPLVSQTITQINGHGHGFKADIYVDDGMPEYVQFEIAHLFDGKASEDGEESVGLLLTPTSARMLADRLREAANRAENEDLYSY